jgi:hypothetical protein
MQISTKDQNKKSFRASSLLGTFVRTFILFLPSGTKGLHKGNVRGRYLAKTNHPSSATTNFSITSLANLENEAAHQSIIGTTAPPLALAQKVAGPSVTITSATIISGNSAQFGTFSGGTNVIGFEEGIVLSTGKVNSIKGECIDPLQTHMR